MVDRKKGEIFFNLGLTLHQLGKHLESAKHLQWASKLSPELEAKDFEFGLFFYENMR